jgi:preprotein translocase subunit SecA
LPDLSICLYGEKLAVDTYCPESLSPAEWDTDTMYEYLNEIFPLSVYARTSDLKGKKREEAGDFLLAILERTYEDREQQLGSEFMREIERYIALRAINNKWVEHLDAMDYLREGIGLRGYAQQDPLVAYKKEAFDMFSMMLENIQDEICRMIYRVQVQQDPEPYRNPYRNIQMFGGDMPASPDFEMNPAEGMGGDAGSGTADACAIPKSRQKRSMPLRKRQKVQKVLS